MVNGPIAYDNEFKYNGLDHFIKKIKNGKFLFRKNKNISKIICYNQFMLLRNVVVEKKFINYKFHLFN